MFDWAWLGQLAAGLVLAGAALAVLTKGVRWLFAILRKISEFLEDWRGEEARPGYQKRPGVMERLVSLEEQMSTVAHEVKPNSGSSLKDQVTRIEERITPAV